MAGFGRKYSTIDGISERRRLPMLGKIRLGVVIKNKSGNSPKCKHPQTEYCDFCSHPSDVSYFIVPPEVQRVYGEKPTELEVMLPINDIPTIFPQALRWWGVNGLKCEGNRIEASRWDEATRQWMVRDCPCEELKGPDNPDGQCNKQGTLYVMLHRLNMGGVYRIVTGSSNTLIDVSSGLEFAKELLGRFALVPLILKREKREITYTDNKGKQHKSTHYPLVIRMEYRLKADTPALPYTPEDIMRYREDTERILPKASVERVLLPTIDDNPRADTDAVVVTDEEEVRESSEIPASQTGQEEAEKPQEQGKKGKPKPEMKPIPKTSGGLSNDQTLFLTQAQGKKIFVLCGELRLDTAIRKTMMMALYKKGTSSDLTIKEAGDFIEKLTDLQKGACNLKYGEEGNPYFEYPPAQGDKET